MNGNRDEDHISDISQTQRIQLTNMGAELERSNLIRCLKFYRDQSAAGKLVLFYEYNNLILDVLKNVYRACIQPYTIIENREAEYLGFRNINHFDYNRACKMEQKLDVIFKDSLLMDDEDYPTVSTT